MLLVILMMAAEGCVIELAGGLVDALSGRIVAWGGALADVVVLSEAAALL